MTKQSPLPPCPLSSRFLWRLWGGSILLASWLSFALTTALQAQTVPPSRLSLAAPTTNAAAADPASDAPLPTKVLGQVLPTAKYAAAVEVVDIVQTLFPFHSPYSGTNSLLSRRETEGSHSATLYLGVRPAPRLEIYVNPEIALGTGISAGDGLAGYSNGNLLGRPALSSDPYLARAFVRWRILFQSGGVSGQKQSVKPGSNVIGGSFPASRLVITAGKLAIPDQFDVNTYANNPRLQFLNNAFVNNLAYDFASDTRGYNYGFLVSLVRPAYTLRVGSFGTPAVPGGPDIAYNLRSRHSEQIELDIHPRLLGGHGAQAAVVRLLAYRNEAMMGHYREALEAAPGMTPDVTAVRRREAVKYGFGLNFEQSLGDGGASGVFGRLGWNNGDTETFSYAEADRVVSFGGVLSGVHWKRGKDVLGVALAQSDLSAAHKDYLAAGGLGLSLGDGGLRYGSERNAEAYYAYQLTGNASLSPDYQLIEDPGDNRARGPVSVLALRLHLTY